MILSSNHALSGVQGRADIHVHTKYSGVHKLGFLRFPESITDPEDVVRKACQANLNVLCVTDHNAIAGALKAKEFARSIPELEVVVGEEISTRDGEVLALFINEEIPAGLSIEETIRRIRGQGGLVVAPHPFSLHCPCLGDRIYELDIDGIEVLNGGHIDDYANNKAQDEGKNGRWARMGGSDSHYLKTIGTAYTRFEGRTAQDLREAILNKRTSAAGVTIPLDMAIAWSVGVVIRSDHLMIKSLFHLNRDADPTDPIISRIEKMTLSQKLIALAGSLIYLLPPVPFLIGMTSQRLLRRRAEEERSNGKGSSINPEH